MGGGHFLQEDRGEELAKVVVDFVAADLVIHEHGVVLVGAGFSGVGMAARLKEMGIEDFVVLDRGDDLGGTWRDNSYPGAACDVPSNLYSFSFALNPDWSRAFPSQSEIWDYMRHCVDRFDIGGHLRFGHSVAEARWDEDAERWHIRTVAGEEFAAPVLIWATGSLSEPSIPDFPGLADFRGKVFHSAKWAHGFDLSGKRVCVVGTGASAVQFVPQIAPVVEHLYLHQRTPPFIIPGATGPSPDSARPSIGPLPGAAALSAAHLHALRIPPLGLRREWNQAQGGGPQTGARPPGPPGARPRPAQRLPRTSIRDASACSSPTTTTRH